MKIKFNVSELKEQKGVSYQEISYKTKIRYATLLDIRDNKVKTIKVKYIENLLQYFNCSLNELIGIDK